MKFTLYLHVTVSSSVVAVIRLYLLLDILSAWWTVSIHWYSGSCKSSGQNSRSSSWGISFL